MMSQVDKTMFGASAVDHIGLYSGGWRVGQSICCQWPAMKSAKA